MNPILEAMEQVRQKDVGSRVEIKLEDPSRATLELISTNGGSIESEVWNQLCHTDTCAHNSHPAGYTVTTVAIPPAWQEGCDGVKIAKLFKEVREDRLLFVIPDSKTGPRGVVERYHGRVWGRSTLSLFARDNLNGEESAETYDY